MTRVSKGNVTFPAGDSCGVGWAEASGNIQGNLQSAQVALNVN